MQYLPLAALLVSAAPGPYPQWFPQRGPNFVFIDMVGDDYYVCLANNNAHQVHVLKARSKALFPGCEVGAMNVDAFAPAYDAKSVFPFPPTGGPSQAKLVRDLTGAWFLLAFRSDPKRRSARHRLHRRVSNQFYAVPDRNALVEPARVLQVGRYLALRVPGRTSSKHRADCWFRLRTAGPGMRDQAVRVMLVAWTSVRHPRKSAGVGCQLGEP